MKILYKIIIIASISGQLFSAGLDDFLFDLNDFVVKNGNEEIIYFSKDMKKIKSKKKYKDKYLMKTTNYSYDTSLKVDEYEFTYDLDEVAPSNRYIEKISRYYNTEGYLIEENKVRIVSRRGVRVYTKKYNAIGKPYSTYVSHKSSSKSKSFVMYDDYGNIKIEESYNNEERHTKEYEKGILIKEGIYMPDRANYIPKETITVYHNNGKVKKETFYKNGKYISESKCSFQTIFYIKKLEKQYAKKIAKMKRQDNKCLRVGKTNKYIMMIPYVSYGKNDTQVMISIIDTKNKISKGSLFGKDTYFNHISLNNYIQRISYLSHINANVFEVASDRKTNSGDSLSYFNSYKITRNDKIIKIKTPTFQLDDIENQAKNGKSFDTNLLHSMTLELPVSKQNVEQYNDIALHLQKHKFHYEAMAILEQIQDKFPNRASTFLHLADSWAVKESLDASLFYYNKYEKLMKNQNNESKISKRVQDILKNGKRDYLDSRDIEHKIVKIDDEYSEIVFAGHDDNITKVRYLSSVKVENRMIIKDINFDNIPELIVNISKDINYVEYKVFAIEYGYIYPFTLHTLGKFTLNDSDETLTEYAKDENKNDIVNTYCSDSRYKEYYLCKQEGK